MPELPARALAGSHYPDFIAGPAPASIASVLPARRKKGGPFARRQMREVMSGVLQVGIAWSHHHFQMRHDEDRGLRAQRRRFQRLRLARFPMARKADFGALGDALAESRRGDVCHKLDS